MITLKVEAPQQEISLDVKDFVAEENESPSGGTNDYDKLNNLPKLNGVTIKGNMEETDPTVPAWAKQSDKPTYTPEEIGLQPIPLEEVAKMFEKW